MRAWFLAILIVLPAAPAAQASDPLRSRQWGLDMVGTDAAHAVTTGTGAVVAVIDTGVKATIPTSSARPSPDTTSSTTTTRRRTATGTGRT